MKKHLGINNLAQYMFTNEYIRNAMNSFSMQHVYQW